MAIWPKKFRLGNHGERSQRAHGAGLHWLHGAVANGIAREFYKNCRGVPDHS